MGVLCEKEGRNLTLLLSGEVDHHGAREMMDVMDRELEYALPQRVSLDLGGVTFMDSSGIAVVLRCYRRTQGLQGKLVVKNVPTQAGKVLRAAGLHKMLGFE